MITALVADDILSFHTQGEELTPDQSSYALTTPGRVVVIDPGPDRHVERYLDDYRSLIANDDWLFAVVQSPLPGCLSGLRRLATLSRRRAVVAHWQTVATGEGLLDRWNVRTVSLRGAAIPLGENRKLVLSSPPSATPVGALISHDSGSRTLFSGPYFGAIGLGRRSDRPVLRREAVRAFSDLYTPLVDPRLVSLTFGDDLEIARVAPAHGKTGVGGQELIASLFAEREERPTVAWAFHRLFLRLAAIIGLEAAQGIYQAVSVPVPDPEQGYPGGQFPLSGPEHWIALYAKMQSWISSSSLAALLAVVVRLSLRSGLPVPASLKRLVEATERVATGSTGVGRAGTGRPGGALANGEGSESAGGGERAGSLAEVAPEFDDLTDRVTGLLNESVFRQRLEAAIAGLSGEETSTQNGAVLFVGLDNIQRINSSYGRQGGDEALHTAAYLLRNFQSSRARMGAHRLYKLRGPLFAYVMAEGSVHDGAQIAEQIRQDVAESPMFLEQLTVSVGVIGVEELAEIKTDTGESPVDALVRVGIGRLGVARKSGMNTICSIDPEGVASLGAGSSVLVADPDTPHLDLLTSALRDRGYTVLTATDGAEALSIV